MRHISLRATLLTVTALASLVPWSTGFVAAQEEPRPEIVTFTTQEDHRNMLQQLGISRLRPGPSGNESAPNHANYDEALANPYPNLPPLLVCQDGTVASTKEQWIAKRRPEIVELFEREVVGRIPDETPTVTWNVLEETEITFGETPMTETTLEGVADNSRCPDIDVRIQLKVGRPKSAEKPVPVLIMFSFFGWGRPGTATRPLRFPGPTLQEILARAGWGYAFVIPNSIQPDNGAGLTRGIIGLTNLGQPRKPDDWGALRAWAWGASRALDYLETNSAFDAHRVGIEGVSRYGKAALITMAFDERFAAALVASSGEGGAKLHRRNFGEAVESLTGSGEYHWMAGNFLKYGAAEAEFGSKNAGDIPVDAHQLIALCAPRLVFISYGIPAKGDAKWLDQQGSYMATVAAQPAWRLFGVGTLGVSDDYLTEKMPGVNVGLLSGSLAWRQHDGGHTSGPNLPVFLDWANRKFAESTAAAGR
ncbi:MAG: acetylxylan esterase [Planctomycetes bacterium]|nr:acetylxylan esterase [Planctomycetota bacterium]